MSFKDISDQEWMHSGSSLEEMRKGVEHQSRDRSISESSQEDLARLFVMDKLTGLSKSHSGSNLLADRLGMEDTKPMGKFDAQSGKWYRSATLSSRLVREVSVEALMEALSDVKYDKQTQTGVVFNIIPVEADMEVSLMCIGESHIEVDGQLETALNRVAEALAAARKKLECDTLAGFSLFKSSDADVRASAPSADVQHTCAGITLFSAPSGRPQPQDVSTESLAGMSLFSYTPGAKERKQTKITSAESASTLKAKMACPSHEELSGELAADSCAGMTMFAPPSQWKQPQAQDVVLDSACGMGLFTWNFEGMDEVAISKALSEAPTPTRSTEHGSLSTPRMTPVGSMSSVVSALNDDDVLELLDGFAGFTFFSRAKKADDAEDELVAVESSAGITMFSRKLPNGSISCPDVSAEECAGMTMFSPQEIC
jgi:hypothetical protein